MALIVGRPESILLHGHDCFLVKALAEMTDHADILREALGIDDELNRHDTLKILAPGFSCELRLNRMDDLRSANPAANAHHTTAVTAIAPRSLARAVP